MVGGGDLKGRAEKRYVTDAMRAVGVEETVWGIRSFREIVEAACEHFAAAGDVKPEVVLDTDGSWLHVGYPGAGLPVQGWKLHVSATLANAGEMLDRVLPVLLSEPVFFKLAATLGALNALNLGWGRLSQVGKFITVYPANDAQAVRLAAALDDATRGLQAPAVPSDRPLRPGSVVYYRYGGFGALTVQIPNGEILPALRAPNGDLVPDLRRNTYQAPPWVDDPFLAAGVAGPLPAMNLVLADRYLVLALMHRTARGAIFMAVDLEQPRRCVLKQALAAAHEVVSGSDARDALRREAEVLNQLAGDERFPSAFELFEHDGSLYLAMEDIEGETLEERVREFSRLGRTLPHRQVVAWAREVVAMLGTLHDAGLVYRDLKSTNVLVSPDGALRLIDLEMACPVGTRMLPGAGTRGYLSPQQEAGGHAAFTDDIYGVGALLYLLATNAEPSLAPQPRRLLQRPLRLLNPRVDADLAAIIARCLSPEPADRFPSMQALDDALAAIEHHEPNTPASYGSPFDAGTSEASLRQRSAQLARRLGETLTLAAEPDPNGSGVSWVSRHPLSNGVRARDINTGTAGTILALAELVDEFDAAEQRATLARAARWLLSAPRPGGAPLPGLYVGEAGVGAALLRAGQVLGDGTLIGAATALGAKVVAMPHLSPDYFNGTAGRLLFHLMLWDETGDAHVLEQAVAAGEALLAMADYSDDGTASWVIPDGYGGMSGKRYLGYAHGAAGIADMLLELYEVSGDERMRETAAAAGRWLARQALTALDDDSGSNWPDIEGADSAAAYWCHGAAGIGRFWLHAARVDLLPEADELGRRSLAATSRAARWASAVLCHGHAGGIELLLDAYQQDGNAAHLTEARELAILLEAFSIERDGLLVWPSESPDVITPDYHVGYAGIAATLLRLAQPERRPHLLSRRGFRFRASRDASPSVG